MFKMLWKRRKKYGPDDGNPAAGRQALWIKRASPGLCLALLSLFVAFPFFFGPYVIGYDWGYHLYNTCEYAYSLSKGVVVAHLTPNFYNGLGGINFKYYPPYSYLLPAFLWLGGIPVYRALAAAMALTFLISGLGMYGWAQQFFSRRIALFCGVAYILAPYHLVNLYDRFAYPELWGMALAPWIFWAATRAIRTRAGWPLLLTAGLLILLGLHHNLSALMVALFLAAYWIFTAGIGLRSLGTLAGLFLLALGLGAFYIAPAYLDQGDILISRQFNDPETYRQQGLGSSILKNSSILKCLPGWGLIVIGMLGSLALLRRRGDGEGRTWKSFLWLPILAAAAVLLTTQPGASLVYVIPPLKFLQFPWRFLGMASLFLALGAGGLFLGRSTRISRIRGAVAAMLLAMTVAHTLTEVGLNRSTFTDLNNHASDIETYRRNLRTLIWFSDVENKYMPVWTADAIARRASRQPTEVRAEEDIPTAPVTQHEVETLWFTVESDEPRWEVLLYRIYVPGWFADVEDGEVEVGPDMETGLMRVMGRDVTGKIKLQYTGTIAFRAGVAVSLLSVVVAAALAGLGWLRRRRGLPAPTSSASNTWP